MAGAKPKDGLRVLSFDGPPFPAAALSGPFFLQQIAHRWIFNDDEEDEIEGDDVRVSDMFDIIGGCGIGGLYAILFARLNMTIGQVIRTHNLFNKKLFAAPCWTQKDHQACIRAFDDALDLMVSHSDVTVDLDVPFLSKNCAKCAIVVLNKAKANGPYTRLLRSYRVRVGSSPRCTIRQALHATLADLEHLPAVNIDDEHFICTSAVLSNPSHIFMKDLATSFPKLHLACLVNLGADRTHPMNDSYTVCQDLIAQFRNLGCFFRLSVREELNSESEIKSLVMGYLQEDDISKMMDDIVDALKDRTPVVNLLRLGDLAGEDGKHELRADISQLRSEGEIKRTLGKLRGPFDFPSLYEHGCLEGTRVDVLGHIEGWVEDVNAPNVFWLEGYPGTGKTFVSISLKQRLADVGLLGASCFFRREDASHHRLDSLVRSIAVQLADKHKFIQDALVQAVTSGNVKFEGAPANLFAQLIFDPLRAIGGDLNKCTVVILDAMDEFGRSDADQQHLLTHLLPKWTQLPPFCKLFITGRSQGVLLRYLDLPVHKVQRLTVGDEASIETINDIRLFLQHSIEDVQNSFNSSTAFLTNSQLEKLVRASSGLFIWASTAIQMVKQTSLRRTAKLLLRDLYTQHATVGSTRMQPLYRLYRIVLNPLLGPEESHVELTSGELLAKQTFFSALVSAQIPLSASTLSSLCGAEVDDIQDIVLQLSPVMDTARGLRFAHKSFLDYVMSPDFPLPLNVDVIERAFTDSCFRIMCKQLHFNMGNMPSSYMLNSDMPKLHEALSEELQYASRFWGPHLKSSRNSNKGDSIILDQSIDVILNHRFLYWVEAVSILGCFQEATEALSILKAAGFGKEVRYFAQDALAFLRQFALPISQSYPHIYISAIPWTPTTSLIREKYFNTLPNVLKIISSGDHTWPAQLGVIRAHTDWVRSVAFSPDGSQIVSGSDDMTVRIWDSATRKPVGEPLRGHDNLVLSVAFSPDGSQIVSGSDDNTVRVWDSGTHQPVGEPLRGHNDAVRSVAFSPDGSQIVSGSDDNSVRIWDAETCQPVGNSLLGHDSWVFSVAFSPDGLKIVSGSNDNTIRIWDATTRQPIGEPLQGHSSTVLSVAFSPDGSQIASGSDDKTVRTWDAVTGQPAGEPLRGHSRTVFSVAFSPDGSQIASGSDDMTVRIWDAATRQPVGESLEGHNGWVRSVAYSPDGSQIISGSHDMTTRIWNAATRQPARLLLQGHNSPVRSVAFSPDGSQIVSGSDDNTVRIWDSTTRKAVGEPLQGHNRHIESVAFSPDGSQIVSGADDNTVRIWNAATGQPFGEPLRGHNDSVRSVAFSPDGSLIVSGSDDMTVRIWDVSTRQPVGEPLRVHNSFIISVAFSPNGSQIVSGSGDNTVRIWDLATRKPVRKRLRGHKGSVLCVAFSSDGSQVVSGSDDTTVRIWDAATRKLVGKPFRGHYGSVRSVAFSPDGSQIVSGSDDMTVRIWDAVTFQPIGAPLEGHSRSVRSVAFSPDGSQIVSGSEDMTVRIWDAAGHHPPGDSFEILKKISFPRVSHLLPLNCFLLSDGWMVDQHASSRLVWVPQHLHEFLPTPGLIDIIGARRMLVIDASDMKTGSEWSSGIDTN